MIDHTKAGAESEPYYTRFNPYSFNKQQLNPFFEQAINFAKGEKNVLGKGN